MAEQPDTPVREVGDKLARGQGAGISTGGSPDDADAKKKKLDLERYPAIFATFPNERPAADPEARLAAETEKERLGELWKNVDVHYATFEKKLDRVAPLLGRDGNLDDSEFSPEEIRQRDKETKLRDAVLNFFEAHGAKTLKPLMEFTEEILGVRVHDAAAVEHHPDAPDAPDAADAAVAADAAAAPARLGDEPASVLVDGLRFKCASKVPSVTGSETITAGDLSDATKERLQLKISDTVVPVDITHAVTRRDDGKRLDAPVSNDELASQSKKLLAFIKLFANDKELSLRSLQELPARLRTLILSGVIGPLLLSGARGMLAETEGFALSNRDAFLHVELLRAFVERERRAADPEQYGAIAKANFEFLKLFKEDLVNEKTKREADIAFVTKRRKAVIDAFTEANEEAKATNLKNKKTAYARVEDYDTRFDAFERARRDGVACRQFLLALLRDATAETEPLPPWLQTFATCRLTHEQVGGETILTLAPIVESWSVSFLDSLRWGRGSLVPESTFGGKKLKGTGTTIPVRNASSLTGGRGSGGGRAETAPSAEMRAAHTRHPPPPVVAALHAFHAFCPGTSLPLDFEYPGYQRDNTNVHFSGVSVGKIRHPPPSSVANAVARLYGPGGIFGDTIDRKFVVFGEDAKLLDALDSGKLLCDANGLVVIAAEFTSNPQGTLLGDVVAAYLLFRALALADYASLRADPTRHVFPVFTDVALQSFQQRAMRGFAYVAQKFVAREGVDEVALTSMNALCGIISEEKRALMEGSAGNTQAGRIVKSLLRVAKVLAPLQNTPQAAMSLSKIAGARLLAIRVQVDFKRYRELHPAASSALLLPAPAAAEARVAVASTATPSSTPRAAQPKTFYAAMDACVPLFVAGIVRVSGLVDVTDAPSLDTKLSESFSGYVRVPVAFGNVSTMNVLRVSCRATLVDENRNGFKSQLDILRESAAADGVRWLPGIYAACDLSRFLLDAEKQPFALAVEDPVNHLPIIPGLGEEFLKTAPLLDAPLEAIKQRTGRDVPLDSDVVVVRVAHASRLSLPMLVELRARKVVGVDAMDLRPLLRQVPCLRLGEDALATVIDVRGGSPGFAVLALMILFSEASVLDQNAIRLLGMLAAAAKKPGGLDDALKDRLLDSIARDVARVVKQYDQVVFPAFHLPDLTSGASPGEPDLTSGASTGVPEKPLKLPKAGEPIVVAYRRSTEDQAPWDAQEMATKLIGIDVGVRGRDVTTVRLSPFRALQSLRDLDKATSSDVTSSDVLKACAWATTSRFANQGILENARKTNSYLNSFDFAVAAARRTIGPRWVRNDVLVGNRLSASLNLNDDYVYTFMLALRGLGHYYDRLLKAELTSRGFRDVFFDDEEEGT